MVTQGHYKNPQYKTCCTNDSHPCLPEPSQTRPGADQPLAESFPLWPPRPLALYRLQHPGVPSEKKQISVLLTSPNDVHCRLKVIIFSFPNLDIVMKYIFHDIFNHPKTYTFFVFPSQSLIWIVPLIISHLSHKDWFLDIRFLYNSLLDSKNDWSNAVLFSTQFFIKKHAIVSSIFQRFLSTKCTCSSAL